MSELPHSKLGAPLLRASGIRKSFSVGDRQLEVLHGLDLELASGELLCLMGSSGAGKTTLLNILALLDAPTEGQVSIAGQDGWSLSSVERSKLRNKSIGFVFQFYHLLPELNALENVLLPAMIAHSSFAYRRKRKEYESRARGMLVEFGLESRISHKPGQLSGGEQQRIAIARALLMDPPLIIADEPTGNLDRGTGDKVLELLFHEQKQRNVAMLLVTHDQSLARRCERVVYLGDGQIEGDSTLPIPH
ncbi:MAG: lipoprotein-releasing system ATP-binding protein [Planctomycetota bacterium]|jgi:lipoprotein-releasing system ATP-binding protein